MATVPDPGTLDLSTLPEEKRLAFYGALFAIAMADDSIDERESRLISDSLHLGDLSDDARRAVLAQAIDPPDLARCLQHLKDADEAVRYGLMLNLVDVVLADDAIAPGEHEGLRVAREVLGVTEDLVGDMHDEAYKAHQARAAGRSLERPLRFVPVPREPAA